MVLALWKRNASYPSAENVQPAELHALYSLWLAARCGDNVPAQSDLSIDLMRPILPNMALLSVDETIEKLRYRIVGTALIDLLGEDPTGRMLDQIYQAEIYAEIHAAVFRAVTQREPIYYDCDFMLMSVPLGYRRLLLPIMDNSGQISRVIVGIYPKSAALRHARQWRSAVRLAEKAAIDVRVERAWRAAVSVLAADDTMAANTRRPAVLPPVAKDDFWLI